MKANTATLELKPITEHPEFKSVNDKQTAFVKQRNDMQKELDFLTAELLMQLTIKRTSDDKDAIKKADDLMLGVKENPITNRITELTMNISVLNKAIDVQQSIISVVNAKLSAELGNALSPKHKEITARMVKALKEFNEANTEEWQMRDNMLKLGYFGSSLPAMQYGGSIDYKDSNGSEAYYWYKDASGYIA